MEKETLLKQYNELKQKYKVEHLLNDNKEVIFILESPHVDELLNQAPVSGLSGKAMSKVLFGKEEQVPIGIKTKGEPKSKVGIMNICPIPMQRIAYTNEKVVEMYGELEAQKYQSFFDVLEKLRTNTKTTYKEQVKNELQEIILDDFKNELNKMKDTNLVIIPCGKTAEAFFEASDVESGRWKILKDTPHPSFGNWHKKNYQQKIKEIKNIVKLK